MRSLRTLRLLSVPKGVDCQNQLEYREAYESLQNYARLIFLQSFFHTWKGRHPKPTHCAKNDVGKAMAPQTGPTLEFSNWLVS